MKVCVTCQKNRKNKEFRVSADNTSLKNECKTCEHLTGGEVDVIVAPEITRDIRNPEEAKEISMKRMLAGAKNRAKQNGLMFNLNYADQSP